MIKYSIETVAQCIAEIKPLNYAHWAEIATHKDIKVLDPDYDRYYKLEELGMLRIYTVRDSGILIGYYISMIMPHMHYQTCITALNDILYVHPDYRGGTVAYRMFTGALKDLKDNTDTNVVIVHMKVKHPFKRLLTKLGFEQTEENWEVQL